MLHAGVADHRQWQAAFEHFSASHRVLRYDQRGFGKSEPVAGDYRAIDDLQAVLDAVDLPKPLIMMGCSMGGSLAMDYTISHPEAVSALIMVCSGPSGLKLDLPHPDAFAEVEKAFDAGDLELTSELETRIWFDGLSREPGDVDPEPRALLDEMNLVALRHETRELGGNRQRDLEPAAYARLDEIDVPVLVVAGTLDLPFTAGAADYMCEGIKHARRVDIEATAHLPSMERPAEFNEAVESFLREI